MTSSKAAKAGAQPFDDPGADNVICFMDAQQTQSEDAQDSSEKEIYYGGAPASPEYKQAKDSKWLAEVNPFDETGAIRNDIESLTKTELHKKYPKEYRSWSNLKQRLRKKCIDVHPDVKAFADFLRSFGKQPEPGFTIDRIDTTNPEYSRANCRWASKRLQTANRTITRFIEDAQGHRYSLARWEEITGIKASTARSRIDRQGWTIDEAVYTPVGQRRGSTATKAKPPASKGLWSLFDRLLREHHDQAIVIATGKDRKMLDGIKKHFEEYDLDPRAALERTLTNWDEFKEFAKDYGVWKEQLFPTVQLLAWSPSLNAMANFYVEHRQEIDTERRCEEHEQEEESFKEDRMMQDGDYRVFRHQLDRHLAKKNAPNCGMTQDEIDEYACWFEDSHSSPATDVSPKTVWAYFKSEYEADLDQYASDFGLREIAEKAWKYHHANCS